MIYDKKTITVRAVGPYLEIGGDMHAMVLDGETVTVQKDFYLEGKAIARTELVVKFIGPTPVKVPRTRKVAAKRPKK